MTILYFVIAYAICFGLAYYFNKDKKFSSNINVWQLNAIEAGITTTAIALLYMHGFFGTWFGPFVFFFLLLGIILLDYYFVDWTLQDSDVLLETTKNSIVVFTKTVLPFVLFLTIFRFWNPVLQILVALILSSVIYLISIPIQKHTKPWFHKFSEWFGESGDSKFLLLFVFAGGIASIFFFSFLVQIPYYTLNQELNMTAYNGYYNIDGFPTDLQNDFRENELLNTQANDLDITILDYHHNDEYLYLYDQKNVYVYRLDTSTLIQTHPVFDTIIVEQNVSRERLPDKFAVASNGDVILIDLGRVYVITPDSIEKLSDVSIESKPFYIDDEVYILSKTSEDTFDVFRYENNTLVYEETIDLFNTSYGDAYVINGHLFLGNSSILEQYNNSTNTFLREFEPAHYDAYQNTMYFVQYYKEAVYMRYYKSTIDGELDQKIILSRHNPVLIAGEEFKYFVDLNQQSGFVEIMNNDFTFTNVYHHTIRGRFSFGNPSTYSYVVDYQMKNDQLEYLQVDTLQDDTYIKLVQIQHKPVALPFDFYTHYSASFFIPVVIALFIPTSNYSITVTITGFDEKTYKKKDS